MLDVDTPNCDPRDTFKILIATDNHLGFHEKDPITGNDSFEAFEETLQIAQEHQVDFVLLGGDLFDSNKPSLNTQQKAIHLMKKYSFGEKEIKFGVVNDFATSTFVNSSAEVLTEAIPNINFLDPNLNVAIPIFSIHGNHDDPSGMTSISALDTLSSMGLVNYIGRCDKLDHVDVAPIVLQKGCTSLAIYGLGHLSDKRFVRLMREQKVCYHQVNTETAFQMLVLHQNRANRGALNFVPISAIPEFFDLVMWGHEHDCLIDPTLANSVYYTQPGSTVPTSLTHGEGLPKHVGLLYVNQKSFHIEPIRLHTVRPLLFHRMLLLPPSEIHPEDVGEGGMEEYCFTKVNEEVERLLAEAEVDKRRRLEKYGFANDKLPLVRVVVQYEDERQSGHYRKVALMFEKKVANSQDLVLEKCLTKREASRAKAGLLDGDDESKDENDAHQAPKDLNAVVEESVKQILGQCSMLTGKGALEAFMGTATGSDPTAMRDYVAYRENELLEKAMMGFQSGDTDADMERKFQELLAAEKLKNTDDSEAVKKFLDDPKARDEMRLLTSSNTGADLDDSDDAEARNSPPEEMPANGSDSDPTNFLLPANSSSTRGTRGRGASRGTRGRGASRGRRQTRAPVQTRRQRQAMRK